MAQEILLRPHEEAYIKEHVEELRKFRGMDLVFEARMRFLEMPPEQREKLAPGWVDSDEPLWQQGGVALSALIEEHSDEPVLVPVPDCSLPRRQQETPQPQPVEEPAPEPTGPTLPSEPVPERTREPEFAVQVLVDTPQADASLDDAPDVRSLLERQLLE